MFGWFKGRTLDEALDPKENVRTKVVKIDGVRFVVRNVSVLDHLAGAQVLHTIFDNYKTSAEKNQELVVSDKKAKEYLSQIIVAGTVSPKLSHKADDKDAIYVERLWANEDIVMGLYAEILELTYGKKKLKSAIGSVGRKLLT